MTSLRQLTREALAALAAVIVAMAIALSGMTSAMHAATRDLTRATENVRLAQQAQVGLLSAERLADPGARAESEERVAQSLQAARSFDGDGSEGVIERARADVDAYRAQRDGPSLDRALTSLEGLAALNRSLAVQALEASERWDRAGDVGGATALVLLVVVIAWVVASVRRAVFAPLLDLHDAMGRFTRGEGRLALQERGARELVALERRFDALCARISEQRDAQLAFVAGVAHDLRTPLSALRLLAEKGARTCGSDGAGGPVFERIGRQVDRLERMLGDLVESSRIEAGHLELRRRAVDLRPLLEDVRGLFSASSTRHEIEIHVPEAPVVVPCDPERLAQVLTNLVSNAVKYSPAGGTVTLALESTPEGVAIVVRDEGLGVPEAERERIFEPFRRTRPDGQIPGTGLGLYVSRRIAEAHGGTLRVRPAPGKGSEFVLTLPRPLPRPVFRPPPEARA